MHFNDGNLSFIQTQVDELNSDRIFQMSVLEFMEALARVADKLSLPDYYSVKLIKIEKWNEYVGEIETADLY